MAAFIVCIPPRAAAAVSHAPARRPAPPLRRPPLAPWRRRRPPAPVPAAATATATATAASYNRAAASTPPGGLLLLASTVVGVCVLIGSALYKIPQIVRVVRRRSAAGISVLMYALETVGTTFSAVYYARRRLPFSTYGEGVFITAQNALILLLIVLFERLPRRRSLAAALLYAFGVMWLCSPLAPMSVIIVLQVCAIPILNLARLPQIVLNLRRKSTGELAPVTLGLQLLGNVARIFTTIAQVRDPLMLIAIAVATCFNTTLFVQWFAYSRRVLHPPSDPIPNPSKP